MRLKHIVSLVVGILLFTGWWLYSREMTHIEWSYRSPQLFSLSMMLGADELGRPFLFKIAHAVVNTCAFSLFSLLCSSILGLVLGLNPMVYRKRLQPAVHFVSSLFVIIPSFLSILLLKVLIERAFGTSMPWAPAVIILAMSLEGWVPLAYFVESEVEYSMSQEYYKSSEALGARPFFLFLHHIWPDFKSRYLRYASLHFPHFILAESFLSFFGLGIKPPYYSVGSLLSIGYESLADAPHLFWGPAVSLIIINFILIRWNRNSVVRV